MVTQYGDIKKRIEQQIELEAEMRQRGGKRFKDRETKAWNKRYAKREKISFYVLAAAWLALLIQGVSSYQEKGILVLLSILGYWVTKSGGLGFFNNFRDLIIRKTSFHGERKIANFLIVICVIYFGFLAWAFGN